MTNRTYLPGLPFAFVAAFLATAMMAGCAQTQQPPASPPPPPPEKVFVIFEGPWGFIADPNDANFVYAMAPKTDAHQDLFVKASNMQVLTSGVYELSVPPRTVAPAGTIVPDIAQATTAHKDDIKTALGNKLHRYAVRLPKPEAYTPYERYFSSVGDVPPPHSRDVTPKRWATAISLQYSVGSLSGFQVAGSPDTGPFQTVPLQVDTPDISFVIYPKHEDDPADKCHYHDRQAFHDLTQLLGVTKYVDYPDSPPTCLDKDPQKQPPTKSGVVFPSLLDRLAAVSGGDRERVDEAGVIPTNWLRSMSRGLGSGVIPRTIAAFFFGAPTADCKAPGLIVTSGGG